MLYIDTTNPHNIISKRNASYFVSVWQCLCERSQRLSQRKVWSVPWEICKSLLDSQVRISHYVIMQIVLRTNRPAILLPVQ